MENEENKVAVAEENEEDEGIVSYTEIDITLAGCVFLLLIGVTACLAVYTLMNILSKWQ